LLEIKKYEHFIFEKYNNLLNSINYKIENVSKNFVILENEIKTKKIFIDNLKNNLINNFSTKLKEIKEKINYFEKEINYCNPKRQLKLGYSILRKDGMVIKSINEINKEDLIDLELLDGIIKSKVYDKRKK